MAMQHEIEIRVRYHEVDAQGHVHHANYIKYFELGRTEYLRSRGRGYEDLESAGCHLVVADIACRYFKPCRFGDTLMLRTATIEAKGARMVHYYKLFRGDELLAEGESTVACVDRDGKVRRLPAWLLKLA